MAIDRDTADFKISQSAQAQTRNNRINHELKMTARSPDEPRGAPGSRTHPASPPTQTPAESPPSRPEKRKLSMDEYEMWRYSYSLVKNGYSILAPEPSQRSRSYRDLILQEMNWMAVDYYQERRWKAHIAKEISNSINTSIIDRKRLKRDWPAKQCSYNVEVFWLKVKETGSATGVSHALHEYCQRMVAGRKLDFSSPDFVEEVPTKRNDLLAITVPVYKSLNTNAVNVAKKEVVNATLNHMLVLGAELYPQVHRPPDDEIDVFTLPALNPNHEFDFNILLLLLHSLNSNMYQTLKTDQKGLPALAGAYRTHTPQTPLSSLLPVRRIPRDEIDPFSLSVNYRDFLDNSPVQPLHVQKLILKWEDSTLSASDFELLDSWMLETRCWPLISIALSLRSSSGGLLRREFGPKVCKDTFSRIEKTPRGLVNSSRKLLGPKQTKTILSFIDAPPPTFKFKLIIPPESFPRRGPGGPSQGASEPTKSDPKESPMKTLFGEVSRFYRAESRLYSYSPGTKKESIFSRFKFPSDSKSDKKLLLKEISSERPDAFVIPNNLRVEVLSTNPGLDLPVPLTEFIKCDGNMELFNRSGDASPTTPAAPARNRFVRYSETEFGVNHRFSSLNSVVTLATSVNSHDNVVRNLGYSELATRMNKQLRIGFLGIPTKMFVYSLFYCGRIKPESRVRKVALSISSISKFIPPPHLLYGKMFDPDINLILTRSRTANYDKQRSKSLESQDSFMNELVQGYSNEVSAFLNTKPDEANVPTLLATFTHVALSKGQQCNQSCFSSNKILIVNPHTVPSATTSNSSSTPTERKRPQLNSIESTPRQKTRQIVDISAPAENQSSYRTRQEVLIRRQLAQTQNVQPMHSYQQMHMMYGMNQPLNNMSQPGPPMNQPMNMGQMGGMGQQMNNMNQPMGGMTQGMGAMGSMGQPMSGMNQHVPQMPQPMGNMNNMGPMNMNAMNMAPINNLQQPMNMPQPVPMSPMGQPMGSMNQHLPQPMGGMGNLGAMNPVMNGKMMYGVPTSQMQHYQDDDSYQYRYDQRQRHG